MNEEPISEGVERWEPHEQRWRDCVGHMEREPGRLQLRVRLCGEEGVCTVLFEEDAASVKVLILVCGPCDPSTGYTDCPVHIYLEEPLGDRPVLDVARERRPVPYFNVYRDLEREFGLPTAGS
jgi:hypothetical protein